MIALNQSIGLAGQVLLIAPSGLQQMEGMFLSPAIPQDCFIDASTTASDLLPSLTAFEVDTKPLEGAIGTDPQLLRISAKDSAWMAKSRQLANVLAAIPEGAFVQAAFETSLALQYQPTPLEEGGRIFLGQIPLPKLQPVPVLSIPFDPKVDPALILPALVTRNGQLRYFNDLASALLFFANIFGEGVKMDLLGSNLSRGCSCTNIAWFKPARYVSAIIFRGKGGVIFETEEEEEAVRRQEGNVSEDIPPYSHITIQMQSERVELDAHDTRDVYVVYEFDRNDKLKLARVTSTTTSHAAFLGGGRMQLEKARGATHLQVFAAGE